MISPHRSLALSAVLLPTALAAAQTTSPDDPIEAIRPRITDTARIVPVGRFQLELGADFGYGGFGPLRTDFYSPGVLRYGATPRLEARLELPTYSDLSIPFNDGFGNLSIAASLLLGRAGKVYFAALPRLTLPTGSRYRRPDEPAPSLFLTAEGDVDDRWRLAATVGGLHRRGDGDSTDVLRATLCAERYIDARFSGFAEYVGTYLREARPGHGANLGARLRLSARTQLDFRWQIPIDNSFAQRSVGVGYAVRF